ncbi:MAG: DUF1156 domain-containing protein [Thermodesulfobacteriota bacterium]
MSDDRRLIEDYLPIQAISKEASQEKSVRKGHISTLHLWWARRPLVACRAAVYGALVPASRFIPENGPDNKKQSLGRANAAKFVERLCKYPGNPSVIKEAQRHILEAHAERLTKETGKKVTVEDIEEGRAPRPKVLDMFAGGGAIPLEALRLGCEAYALDLNPVAHIIELCTLVYPQRYGKPDTNARGMTGPKNDKGETTWGGLASEVRYWGNWVLERVREEIGDLYPPIPDPEYKGERPDIEFKKGRWVEKGIEPNAIEKWAGNERIPDGYLTPVAYLWTRTVRCKNPSCGATVPLVKQTWLCRKKDRNVALKTLAPNGEKKARFEVVEATTERALGFDPVGGSKGGNATCPFCGTVADIAYVKDEGWSGRMGLQLMSAAFTRNGTSGKIYLPGSQVEGTLPSAEDVAVSTNSISLWSNLSVPDAPIAGLPVESRDNSLGITVRPYGMRTWGDIHTARQILSLLAFSAIVRQAESKIRDTGCVEERLTAIMVYLGTLVDRLAVYSSTQYADISDFFYVWLKRTIGHLFPEHFSSVGTPKKKEAVADPKRHNDDKEKANHVYEEMMEQSFLEANRVLKAGGHLVVVYAHKTTIGWATLVEALRRAGFTVVEAWPLDTEMKSRLRGRESSALASSIFLVARKQEIATKCSYEEELRPDLEKIVRERVDTLWNMGITGADLVIAAVGAGLRAFTRFSRVEYANGEEVPAEKFLAEVEGVVLETILKRLSREVGGNGSQVSLEGLDPATRFYVLWRYTYKYRVLDAGEAIVFANGTHVELDGPNGLATGGRALLEKLKGKYKLRDFSDRGDDKKLGMMKENGEPAPLIDALHRVLWLMENRPGEVSGFLKEAQPNREQMRLVAQVLVGPALKGGELKEVSPHAELSALGKLTANWRSVIEDSGLSSAQKKARDRGQDRLF